MKLFVLRVLDELAEEELELDGKEPEGSDPDIEDPIVDLGDEWASIFEY